jgi:lipopolysaccharide biosynthesis glycosyltransferase
MLVSSLLRTFFTGDIVVFRNTENPLFLVERKGLEEVYVETPLIVGRAGWDTAMSWKYKVAEMLDVRGYDKVLFLDSDFLSLRNVDHLLEGDWDIAYQVQCGEAGEGWMFNVFYAAAQVPV